MTAPTATPFSVDPPGTTYLRNDRLNAPPAVVAPAPELSPLDELTARIAVLEAERDAAMKAALDRDPEVARAVGAVLEATEARARLADALSFAGRVLTGEPALKQRRGRRSRHAAVDGG